MKPSQRQPLSAGQPPAPDVGAILTDDRLTRAQKLERLHQLEFDELQLSIANVEGMDGREARLGRIRAALRALETDPSAGS